ncbi:MAG TPA: DUF5996 family protein [Candidatus Acidoferrales bacterium]|nr:DUF5996 family protein [Candidatus Acidoferrales bacterium]
MSPASPWQPLPLADWQDTKDTLQLYMQVAGKLRLALAPPEPQWAQVTLYVTTRGLTTSPIPYDPGAFSVDFDFIAHELIIARDDGRKRTLPLGPRPVSSFYDAVMSLLADIGVKVAISPIPQEVADLTPLDQDNKHASYDAAYVHRFWQILVVVDKLLKRHRAPFLGRHTPVHFFWGSFDLAYTRYTGKPATPPKGAPWLYRTSMDAEEIYAGFWPGDARFPEPAFGCYIYPKPADVEQRKLRPASAFWSGQLNEFLLRYDDVRNAPSPETAVLDFLDSSYHECSKCGNWDSTLLPSA